MTTIVLQANADKADLLDASEGLEELLDSVASADRDPCPPLMHLLFALDDAITEALAHGSVSNAS